MEKNSLVISIIILLRPSHYIKNILVFLPLFFSGQFGDTALLLNASIAFIAFCLVSSSVYVFNDICDVKEDKLHPKNKKRPIASGAVSIRLAYLLDITISIFAFTFLYIVSIDIFIVLLIYKLLNISYTLFFKKISILDILILSLGFVLRLYAGSVSNNIELTVWIIILSYLLSVLIALGKRRNDALFYEKNGIVLRQAIKGYNLQFLNYSMLMISSIIIVAYILYTVSDETCIRLGTDKLFITSFWVLAGVMRYLQLLFVFEKNKNPVNLLINDAPLKVIILGWLLTFLFFLYI